MPVIDSALEQIRQLHPYSPGKPVEELKEGEALTMAIDKGGLSDRKVGEAHLMVGMCEFAQCHLNNASAAWGRASRYDSAEDAAQQWMIHLREERATGRESPSGDVLAP